MSSATLPPSPNLDQLKHQAKDLLRQYRAGDGDVAVEFRQVHPREISAGQAKLTDAQLVLARRYGFASWPKLRLEVAGRQLRKAIWDRNSEAVLHVLDAEPNALHESGSHPMWGGEPNALHLAAERGELDTVRLLLNRGADPNVAGYGQPLNLAAHWGHNEVAELLIDRGAEVTIFDAAMLCDTGHVAYLLGETPALATAPGPDNAPPLHAAGCPGVARLLIEHGARFDTIDDLGNNPIGSALVRGDRGREVALCLIQEGAEADPCQLAALGLTDALERMIAADPATVSCTGKIGLNAVVGQPLHAARDAATVRLFLENGADPNARADRGQTPLHLCGADEIARLLVKAGADPHATDDEHGTTPLVWACVGIEIHGETKQRRELVQYLEEVTVT